MFIGNFDQLNIAEYTSRLNQNRHSYMNMHNVCFLETGNPCEEHMLELSPNHTFQIGQVQINHMHYSAL